LLFHAETITFFFSFLKKDLMMKLSAKCMLLSVSAMSLPALAQEQGEGFENFLLSSPSIVSPSQYYQVKGGRFEAIAGVKSGTSETKPATTDTDLSGQILGAGYAQALSSQLVLGADVIYNTEKQEAGGADLEDSKTEIRPTVAFSISPLFSLGASINIVSGDDENLAGDSESLSYNTFTVGGTLHQDLWEASLALTTANEDDDKPAARSPQTIRVHGRYKIMPVLALGVRYDQADYAGVQASGELPEAETESNFGLTLESAISDNSRVEVAFQSVSNFRGIDGVDLTRIFLSGGFDLASNLELGGQITFDSADADTSKFNLNTYALTFSMMN
jgi:hypothetical protein